jgi:hypothetical protein
VFVFLFIAFSFKWMLKVEADKHGSLWGVCVCVCVCFCVCVCVCVKFEMGE